MPTYDIRGISVHFPFEAYPCQHDFMERAISALQEVYLLLINMQLLIFTMKSENALLESPTGTGKTLCLLSAALAWRNAWVAKSELNQLTSSSASYEHYIGQATEPIGEINHSLQQKLSEGLSSSAGQQPSRHNGLEKRNVPLIVYASRTHSQIAQVIKELNNTVYRPKVAVIGSREQMCIHPKVKLIGSNSAQQAVCHQLIKKKACAMYEKVAEVEPAYTSACQSGKIFDIEDLVKYGQNHQACPYFLSRTSHYDADLVFMPYNYLVDRKARSGLHLDFSNSVIIFDEAHNLESICGDASSFDVTTECLRSAMKEIADVEKFINENPMKYIGSVDVEDAKVVLSFVASFLHQVSQVRLNQGSFTSRVDFVFDMMEKCGTNEFTIKKLIDRMGTVIKVYLEDLHEKGKTVGTCHLQSIETVLRTLYRPKSDDDKQLVPAIKHNDYAAFRIYISQDPAKQSHRTFSLWCFNPGVALRDLLALGIRSLILASGTLSPLNSFAHELQLPFKHQLENMHVIKAESQLLVQVVRAGPNGLSLCSKFDQRESTVYRTELGLAILKAIAAIPDGILVFFPSYVVMEGCLQHWKTTSMPIDGDNKTIWQAICQVKTCFCEPKNKKELTKVIDQYYQSVNQGSILFAVCRGKVSEGIDFADAKGRAVIITGIPFPPLRDPKVMLKRDYLQDAMKENRTASSSISGDEWYNQQASRAVNQAIGRVIRHRNDYGAILFFDERFAQQRIINQLSKWIRPNVRAVNSFAELTSNLSRFFCQLHSTSNMNSFLSKHNLELEQAELSRMTTAKNVAIRQESIQKARNFFRENPFQAIETKTSAPTSFSSEIPTSVIGLFNSSSSSSKTGPTKRPPPTDPINSENTKEIDQAKDYLASVKARLSEDAMRKFNILLKSYKAKKIDCEVLLDSLKMLFEEHNCMDLAAGFRQFVSPRNQSIFDSKFQCASEQPVAVASTTPQLGLSMTLNPRPQVKIEPVVHKLLSKQHAESGPDSTCPICRDKPEKPFKAKCGHVCCFGCWTSWLSNTLECPLCRQRTRLSQLSKIYQ